MNELKDYMYALLTQKQLMDPAKQQLLFEAFAGDEANQQAVNQILNNQKLLMEKWKIRSRVDDILRQHATLPNAHAGKPYEAVLDFEQLQWTDIADYTLEGLDALGLSFDKASNTVQGTASGAGDVKLQFRFRLKDESSEEPMHVKNISFVINPDPKTLWNNLPSPADAPFQKDAEAYAQARLGDRQLIVASKRGRSHANVGAFRDDHFAFSHDEQTGWSLIALADGAGSAKFSREGSRIACDTVAAFIAANTERLRGLDALVQEPQPAGELKIKIDLEVYQLVSGAALEARKAIESAATQAQAGLKDFHTTLVFALFKKYAYGYAILSFSVGDCPLAVVHRDGGVTLLNKLDVGEFSGGTRFLTMPEIFASWQELQARCGFHQCDNFSYLVLMTDGIYDPKFAVEVNLEKPEAWQQFFKDLAGENPDELRVDLRADNPEAARQLLSWMDFWSPGNHDDRTLAIVF